jgi:hypothetical protein
MNDNEYGRSSQNGLHFLFLFLLRPSPFPSLEGEEWEGTLRRLADRKTFLRYFVRYENKISKKYTVHVMEGWDGVRQCTKLKITIFLFRLLFFDICYIIIFLHIFADLFPAHPTSVLPS